MLARAPALTFPSSPPHLLSSASSREAAFYLDTASRSSSERSSPSGPSLHFASESPKSNYSAPHTTHHQSQEFTHFQDSYQQHHQQFQHHRQKTRPGPLPSFQDLTLPPIDVMAMSAVLTPNSLPTPDGQPRMSMTSREWVIPPRPKPGRKPATDTPPTKRKAQNRAAQRAFRERRAARVGELEEQLDQQKAIHDKDENDLKDKIRGLELELQSFRSRCLLLENMLERERKERIRAETEAESHKRARDESFSRHGSIGSLSNALPAMEQRHDSLHSQHQLSSPHILPSLEPNEVLTCGNCGPNSCACADEVLASVTGTFRDTQDPPSLKRPASPSAPVYSDKRPRPDTLITDLTSHNAPPSHNIPKDGCGFCKDGTYCVCADTSVTTPALTPIDTLPPILHQTQTPPPSEPDAAPMQMVMEMTADGAVKLPRRTNNRPKPSQPTSRGCGANGPGTCAQCQSDPKSGLFCRLMAAKLSREGGGSGGCCGGKGPGGGCCKSGLSNNAGGPGKITLPSLPSLGLSCAEAYQTLSSHRNFDKASDDIGSWLPKLRASPMELGGGKGAETSGKPLPIEVEAASIMSVLKDFDVRFGG
jgi:hypothetical protein